MYMEIKKKRACISLSFNFLFGSKISCYLWSSLSPSSLLTWRKPIGYCLCVFEKGPTITQHAGLAWCCVCLNANEGLRAWVHNIYSVRDFVLFAYPNLLIKYSYICLSFFVSSFFHREWVIWNHVHIIFKWAFNQS